MPEFPILYSFRRCPYAIRARLAIKVSKIQVELREVLLADKPKELLACSPKGTVPVLVLPDGEVIEESLDIMYWALSQLDPFNWLQHSEKTMNEVSRLIDCNDNDFKHHLDRYKYADRFPEQSMETYRLQAEGFLQELEEKLSQNQFLISNEVSLADMAILPFVRQFAHVDRTWFYDSQYQKLQAWLDYLLEAELFSSVMKKYPRWRCCPNILEQGGYPLL